MRYTLDITRKYIYIHTYPHIKSIRKKQICMQIPLYKHIIFYHSHRTPRTGEHPARQGLPEPEGTIAPQREFTHPQSNGLLVVIEVFFFLEKLEVFFCRMEDILVKYRGLEKNERIPTTNHVLSIVADRLFFKVLTHRVFFLYIFQDILGSFFSFN